MGSDVNKVVTITLTVEQWNKVLEALQELPAKIANPINNLIVNQAQEQLKVIDQVLSK